MGKECDMQNLVDAVTNVLNESMSNTVDIIASKCELLKKDMVDDYDDLDISPADLHTLELYCSMNTTQRAKELDRNKTLLNELLQVNGSMSVAELTKYDYDIDKLLEVWNTSETFHDSSETAASGNRTIIFTPAFVLLYRWLRESMYAKAKRILFKSSANYRSKPMQILSQWRFSMYFFILSNENKFVWLPTKIF